MTTTAETTTNFGLLPQVRRNPLLVTQSDIAAFKGCRRSWWLGSYLGLSLASEPVVGPLTLGTRVHKAMELYYTDGRPLAEAYVEIAKKELKRLEDSEVLFDRTEWESENELGRIMLEGYEEWLAETGADSDYEILGAEKRLSHHFDILEVDVELRGKVDIRVRNRVTGARLVVDNKTTAHFSNLAVTAAYNSQLKTYMLLERLADKEHESDWVQGALFNMLRKVKRGVQARPPFYERLEVHHNDAVMRSFYVQTVGVLRDYVSTVKALDAGTDPNVVAYPTAGAQCRYCPFRAPCLLMDDGSRVDDMIRTLYTQSDPHLRYDELPAFSDTSENAAY